MVSYDLAVWEGERPSSDEEAGAIHSALYDWYVDSDEEFAPAPLLVEFVNALLARWPDLGDDDGDEEEETPWSTGPLIGEVCGPYMYFPMSYSRAEEASAFAASVAAKLGLVCFDPQLNQLRA